MHQLATNRVLQTDGWMETTKHISIYLLHKATQSIKIYFDLQYVHVHVCGTQNLG